MIKSSNNDISNITYGNNKIEKVYLGDSLIWPSKHLTPHLTPEFEVVDGIENASGNFEDVYDSSLNAWFKKAKQYDEDQHKIVTTSKYILYGVLIYFFPFTSYFLAFDTIKASSI